MSKKCENCNTVNLGDYGSGRFCSSKCARGFSTKEKRLEINKKVSNIMKEKELKKTKNPKSKSSKNINKVIEKKLVICVICSEHFLSKNNNIYCSKKCSTFSKNTIKNCKCCLKDFSARKKQIFCSRKCCGKYTQNKLLENNTHKGWESRKDKTPSWAEQFVIDKLDLLGIEYKRDYKINRFFGDFAFLEKRIVLEIDGKQHLHRVDFDKNRDLIIEKENWKVIRIPWKHKNFKFMHKEIDNFLITYIL